MNTKVLTGDEPFREVVNLGVGPILAERACYLEFHTLGDESKEVESSAYVLHLDRATRLRDLLDWYIRCQADSDALDLGKK